MTAGCHGRIVSHEIADGEPCTSANHQEGTLKRQLEAEGIVFQSQTDTEVVAQLIACHLDDGDLVAAVRKVAQAAQGDVRAGRRQPAEPRT